MIYLKTKTTILALILFILLTPFSVFAEEDLIVTKWTVNANLLDNGDLSIVEDITYNFHSKFNGIYRDIVLKGTDGIENLSIYEIVKGNEMEYDLDQKSKKGDTNVYSTKSKNNSINLMIYSPSKNESKTFRFKYTLNNVAIKHIDTGELYYKFLGKENDTPIDYFSTVINLPQFHKDRIKIFGHGPLNGEINFMENNLIKLEAKNVPSNTFIEARVLFPKEYILNTNNNGNNTLDNILNEEKALAKQIEEDTIKREKRKNTLNILSLGLITLGALSAWISFNKFRRDPFIFQEISSLYPEEISPAELSLFMGFISPRSYLATLFDLSRRGFISVEEVSIERKKKRWQSESSDKDFQFTKKGTNSKDLLEHEIFLLDWLFNDMGDGHTVNTYEIEKYREKNSSKFYSNQNKWSEIVSNQLKARDYYDFRGNKTGAYLLVLSLVFLVIGVISIINQAYWGVVLVLMACGIFIYSITFFQRKSDKGYIQYRLWKDFKNNIEKFHNKNFNIPNDKSIIYAIALELPMKDLNNYRSSIGMDYYPMYWGYWFFLNNKHGGSIFEDRFNGSFYGNTGSSTSNSTSFGGGGGFTGGGGGGAGGGGTGGF